MRERSRPTRRRRKRTTRRRLTRAPPAPTPTSRCPRRTPRTTPPFAVAPPELAWYKLTETGGNVAHDSTANGCYVVLQIVAWGAGAHFVVPDSGAASGGSTTAPAGMRRVPVSFTAWLAPSARSDETANSYGITPFPSNAVSADVPGLFGFGIGVDVWTEGTPGSAFAVENVGSTFNACDGGGFVANEEYFVVAAIGASTATLYVDGRRTATAPVTMPGAAATATLSLGTHNGDVGYGSKRFYAGRCATSASTHGSSPARRSPRSTRAGPRRNGSRLTRPSTTRGTCNRQRPSCGTPPARGDPPTPTARSAAPSR